MITKCLFPNLLTWDLHTVMMLLHWYCTQTEWFVYVSSRHGESYRQLYGQEHVRSSQRRRLYLWNRLKPLLTKGLIPQPWPDYYRAPTHSTSWPPLFVNGLVGRLVNNHRAYLKHHCIIVNKYLFEHLLCCLGYSSETGRHLWKYLPEKHCLSNTCPKWYT